MHLLMRQRARRLLTMLLLPMMLASCSGNTNSTGPASPLPTGQNGSLELWSTTGAGCYVPDGTSSCSSSFTGAHRVTALTTLTVSTASQYLYVGDSQGAVYAWKASSSAPSSSSETQCTSFSFSGTPVSGLASFLSSSSTSSTYYVFAVDGTTVKVDSGTSVPCGGTISTIPSSLPGTTVGLAVATGNIYGVTSSGQYYSVAPGSVSLTSSTTTFPKLPNLPSTATIGGITADQTGNGIVFVTDYANSAIYAYYANSNGTLSPINGTFSGNVDITNPKAITTVYAPNGTSNGCTTGPCEFLYVTNYSYAVVQLSLSINGSGTSTSVGYTEFNAPYTSCEIIAPVAMTSFPDVVSTPISPSIPWVFIGQNGKEASSSCFGQTTYGDSVTAYKLTGE